ncbi:signal transduction histidine kinase [Peribacillus sp. B2I2]
MVGIRERVELLEGEMTIDSQSGAGTLVFIQIPYHL